MLLLLLSVLSTTRKLHMDKNMDVEVPGGGCELCPGRSPTVRDGAPRLPHIPSCTEQPRHPNTTSEIIKFLLLRAIPLQVSQQNRSLKPLAFASPTGSFDFRYRHPIISGHQYLLLHESCSLESMPLYLQ